VATARTLDLGLEFEFEIEAGLFHDLRNSLAALRLLVEAVRDGVMEATPSTVDQMLVHVGLLGALIDAQSDGCARRRGVAASQAVCIASLLRERAAAMGPEARRRQVDLRLVVAPDLLQVQCRPDEISRVLTHLIDNAIRHAPAGGRVIVRGLARRDGVQVEVDDSAPGRTPRDCAAMPDRPRVLATSSAGGLGLTIARTIVQAHGGVLWAGSPPSAASLRFYLPAIAKTVE